MAHKDVPNGIFSEERVIKAKTVARYSEYMGYAERFQQLYEGIPALHFHVFYSVAMGVQGGAAYRPAKFAILAGLVKCFVAVRCMPERHVACRILNVVSIGIADRAGLAVSFNEVRT
jgi:hypothetical protein